MNWNFISFFSSTDHIVYRMLNLFTVSNIKENCTTKVNYPLEIWQKVSILRVLYTTVKHFSWGNEEETLRRRLCLPRGSRSWRRGWRTCRRGSRSQPCPVPVVVHLKRFKEFCYVTYLQQSSGSERFWFDDPFLGLTDFFRFLTQIQ